MNSLVLDMSVLFGEFVCNGFSTESQMAMVENWCRNRNAPVDITFEHIPDRPDVYVVAYTDAHVRNGEVIPSVEHIFMPASRAEEAYHNLTRTDIDDDGETESEIADIPMETITTAYIPEGITRNNGFTEGMSDETRRILNEAIEETLRNSGVQNVETSDVVADEPEPEPITPIEKISDSVADNDRLLRFKDAPWFEIAKQMKVAILGQGGIGSWLTMAMSRLCPECIKTYDDDIVESHNLAGQMFRMSDVGKPKVVAVDDVIRDFSGYSKVMEHYERYKSEKGAEKIMMCGFDNMTARQEAFDAWLRRLVSEGASHMKEDTDWKKEYLFMDGRLNAEMLQVFCIRGDDDYNIDRYKSEFLFPEWQAVNTSCSYKQTSFCAMMIGSLMTNMFVNFCTNLSCDGIRPLPFMTAYDAKMVFMKLEL